MNFDQILPYVPKGVASILNNNMDKAVFEVSVRDCVANDKSIQFCGPVAGSIQYICNLSFHYHAGGEVGAVQDWTPERSDPLKTGQKLIGSSPRDHKWQDSHQAVQAPETRELRLHCPGKAPMPVLATYDPNTEGNWIASRLVKRLEFKHQQALTHKEVPILMGQKFEKTRIFVDLTCGRQQICRHRFYVVNHFKTFDILMGEQLCK